MFALDTNIVIAVMTERSAGAVHKLREAALAEQRLCVSTVVLSELWYGAENSVYRARNRERVMEFLSGPVEVIALDSDDAKATGSLRASLAKLGRPIGANDLLIAGQALARGMTLVTDNVREFGRVAGLRVENWIRP
jgi:tRNA(fMet)-specific endonuclease VapC